MLLLLLLVLRELEIRNLLLLMLYMLLLQHMLHMLRGMHAHPPLPILQLNLYLAQPEQQSLFLLCASGDLGPQQRRFFATLFHLGGGRLRRPRPTTTTTTSSSSSGKLRLNTRVPLKQPRRPLPLLVQAVQEVGALVVELLERARVEGLDVGEVASCRWGEGLMGEGGEGGGEDDGVCARHGGGSGDLGTGRFFGGDGGRRTLAAAADGKGFGRDGPGGLLSTAAGAAAAVKLGRGCVCCCCCGC
jgi:hypothetical protein